MTYQINQHRSAQVPCTGDLAYEQSASQFSHVTWTFETK